MTYVTVAWLSVTWLSVVWHSVACLSVTWLSVAWPSVAWLSVASLKRGLASRSLAPGSHLVAAVEDIDHSLRVRVPLVAGVRGAVVDHGLVDGVGGLVGEDAGGEARHQLLHLVDAAALHHVVVDQDVLAEKFHLVLEVAEQPSYLQVRSEHAASKQAANRQQSKASR